MVKHGALAACLLVVTLAGDLAAEGPRPSVRHLGTDQGLSHPDVYWITADPLGILWIATSAGLDRYDGATVRPLEIESELGTTSEDWSVVFRSRDGDLWVGTWGLGLFHLSFPDLSATSFAARPGDSASLSDDRVQGVFEDRSGALWIATFNGLNRLERESGSFERFVHRSGDAASLASNRVWGLAQGPDGALWVAHDAGLDRRDGEAETFHRVPGATAGGSRARAVLAGRDGTLWVGGQPGLRRSDDRGAHFVDVALGAGAAPTINALFEDRDRQIWVGTLGQGLFRLDGDRTVHAFRPDPADAARAVADDVRTFYQDDNDLLWIGTRGGGVSALDLRPSRFELIATPAVQDVIAARDGTIWIASLDGLRRHDAGGALQSRLEVAPGGPLDGVPLRLRELGDGRLAIGTRSAVVLYHPETGEAERLEHDPGDPASFVGGVVWALLVDRAAGLWIGTDRGLDRFDPATGRLDHYRSKLVGPEGLADGFVRTLTETRDGELLIGTDIAGLFVLDRDRRTVASFRHQRTRPESLADDRVTAILEDRRGTVWIGSGAGLERWDRERPGGSAALVHAASDLPKLQIQGLLEDDAGFLWASTAIGLYRLDPDRRRLEVHRPGRGRGSVFSPGAAARSPAGDLLFGGLEGVVRWRSSAVGAASEPPKLTWTGLRVLNRVRPFDPWSVPEEVVLAPGEWQFAVDFAALDYRDPGRHRFEAMLEGHDFDWVDLGNRNTVAYTQVAPGDYLLRVRTADEGFLDRSALRLPIRVRPAFHQTLGFRLALGLLALALLFAADRLRLRSMERRRQLLETTVRDRTAQIESQKAELELAYRRVEELSLSDPLTGLSNRRFLTRTIDSTIAHGLRAARDNAEERVIFSLIDIDHFKQVNDRRGHDAGDRVLEQFARRLSELRRAEDSLVRWGGEEFLLVSRVETIAAAAGLAERLRRSIAEEPFLLPDGTELDLTCSIGFAPFPLIAAAPGAVSWEGVVSLADKALYAAKTAGRDTWVGVRLAAGVRFEDLDGHLHEDLPALIDRGLVEVVRSARVPLRE